MRHILCILLILSLASCKKNKPGPENNNGYDPNKPSFKAGTTWIYHYTTYQSNGTVNSEDDISFIIVKDTVINGSKYFVTSDKYYFSNKTDGYYEYDRNINQENLIYKLYSNMPYQGFYLTIPD